MQNQAKTIKEFKDFLLNLIDRRKKGEELDFNKEICKKFNLELTRFDDVTMVYNDSIHCYDNEGVIDSKWSIFLDLFDYDNIESSNEKNIDVNKLLVKYNIVSSCFYYLIVIENKLYRVKGYSFLNDNLVGDNYLNPPVTYRPKSVEVGDSFFVSKFGMTSRYPYCLERVQIAPIHNFKSFDLRYLLYIYFINVTLFTFIS